MDVLKLCDHMPDLVFPAEINSNMDVLKRVQFVILKNSAGMINSNMDVLKLTFLYKHCI